MKANSPLYRWLFTAVLALAGGCSSSDSGGGAASTAAYSAHALVANRSGLPAGSPAAHVDSNLQNPWGIAFEPSGDVWVANNGTNTSTLYDGAGVAAFVVSIPQNASAAAANPTGIVYNGTPDFAVTPGSPAQFIFSGEGGTLAAWASGNSAVTMYDGSAGGAVYKGLALARNGSANFLYATDFHNNKVDVFDATFRKVTPAGSFSDPDPALAGYAPFGIQNVSGDLYVTYAKQLAPDNHDNENGPGLGFVDLFDPAGTLVRRVISNGALNAPWGIALAPMDFGPLSGALLVGNFGDGVINAYHPGDGMFLGSVRNTAGAVIAYPGLWGIAFGNDAASQPHNALFMAAGLNDEADGLYARVDMQSSNPAYP